MKVMKFMVTAAIPDREIFPECDGEAIEEELYRKYPGCAFECSEIKEVPPHNAEASEAYK